MKTMSLWKSRVGIGMSVVAVAATMGAGAELFDNVAVLASNVNRLPTQTVSGDMNDIIDGELVMFGGSANGSSYVFTNDATRSFSPYVIWNESQTVQTIRVFGETAFGNVLQQVRVDTLTAGGDPTVEGDWIQRYDTGVMSTVSLVDINLGAAFNTNGVRIRASNNPAAGDTRMPIGEIEIYNTLYTDAEMTVAGSLADLRLTPVTWSASSSVGGTNPSFAGQMGDRWLGLSADNNPGDAWHLDRTFSNATLNAISIGWKTGDANSSEIPSAFTLLADTGSGFSVIDTFSVVHGWDYYEFSTLSNIQTLRVLVAETAVSSGSSIGVGYSEAFFGVPIPEPATSTLLLFGSLAMLRRRRV